MDRTGAWVLDISQVGIYCSPGAILSTLRSSARVPQYVMMGVQMTAAKTDERSKTRMNLTFLYGLLYNGDRQRRCHEPTERITQECPWNDIATLQQAALNGLQ